jgi:hypothetical protein
MRAARSAASIVRHAGGAVTEALLVAALIGVLAIAFGPVYAPASFLSGAENAAAAKGGGGPKAGSPSTGCEASPTQVGVGDYFAVYGNGLPASQTVYVYFDDTTSSAPDPWPPTLVTVKTKADGSLFFMMDLLHWGDFEIRVLAQNKYSSQAMASCWVYVKS